MMGADDENASPHAAKAFETLPIQKQPRSDRHEHSTTKTIAQYFDLERLLLDSLGRSHDSGCSPAGGSGTLASLCSRGITKLLHSVCRLSILSSSAICTLWIEWQKMG